MSKHVLNTQLPGIWLAGEAVDASCPSKVEPEATPFNCRIVTEPVERTRVSSLNSSLSANGADAEPTGADRNGQAHDALGQLYR